MVNKYGISLIGVLLLVLSALPAAAQFEGKIVFNSYNVASDGTRNQNDQFTMYLTKNRILLEGQNRYNFVGSIQTEGILVRLDFQDFVFLTGDESAMKISREDINSMMNMFGSGSSSSRRGASDYDVNYKKTGETSEIKGYTCEKFVFTDSEDPNNHAEVWMTDELKINWGMLAEPWGNADIDMLSDQFSFNLIFKDGYFPLKIEGYRGDQLTDVTEAAEINRSNVARAMVQIPQGVKVLSFQDYLFNKMSEQ